MISFFKRKGKVHKIDNDYQSGKVVYGNTRGGAYHSKSEADEINKLTGRGKWQLTPHEQRIQEDMIRKQNNIKSYSADEYDQSGKNKKDTQTEIHALPDPQLFRLQQMGQKSIRVEPHLEKDFFLKDIDHVNTTRWGENKDIYPSNFNRVVREGELPKTSPYYRKQL